MGPFSTIEEWLERLFGLMFRPVGPAGFSERLVREVDRAFVDHLRPGVNKVYAPNVFEIRVSPDYGDPPAVIAGLERELAERIAASARDREYSLLGPIRVGIRRDSTVRSPGRAPGFTVQAFFEPASEDAPLEGTQVYKPEPAPGDGEVTTRVFRRLAPPDVESPRPRPIVRFRVTEGPNTGAEFEFPETSGTIGRMDGCLIALNDPNVSRVHAELEVSLEATVLRDSESTNGTWVNGRRIARRSLRDGDRIRLGTSELLYSDLRPGGGK